MGRLRQKWSKWSIRGQKGVPFFKAQESLLKSPASQALLAWACAQLSAVPGYIVHLPNDNESRTYFVGKYRALPLHAIRQKGCKMCHSINFKQNPFQKCTFPKKMWVVEDNRMTSSKCWGKNWQPRKKSFKNKGEIGTSLVVQWLRIHLPEQGTRVWSLGQEDPTCQGASRPVCCNYWGPRA